MLSRIGPFLRSKAIYLRNEIGISYRKVPRVIDELFKVSLTPATLLGFEEKDEQRAEEFWLFERLKYLGRMNRVLPI